MSARRGMARCVAAVACLWLAAQATAWAQVESERFRSAKMLFHLERRPVHLITMMPVYILISFVMSGVKLGALLTIRQQRWLTRDVRVSVKTHQVVRTRQPADPGPAKVTA